MKKAWIFWVIFVSIGCFGAENPPLYLKVKMLSGQITPAAIHLFIRHGKAPYYQHLNINSTGLYKGTGKGADDMPEARMSGGGSSPWIKISDVLRNFKHDNIRFTAITGYRKPPEKESHFELLFAKTPDDEAVFKRISRSGPGNGMLVSISLENDTIVSDLEGSRTSLENARNTPDYGGKAPVLYPIGTGMALPGETVTDEVFGNEMDALKLIGVNHISGTPYDKPYSFPFFRAEKSIFYLIKDKCRYQPNVPGMEEVLKSYAGELKQNDLLPKSIYLKMHDEPKFDLDHFHTCEYCIGKFPDYLKSQKIDLADAPTIDPKAGALYYWSMRYRNHIMTEAFRTCTEAAEKYLPGIPALVNFGIPLLYRGNMIHHAFDWFEIYGSRALTYGWGEDWANSCRTYQVNGFYVDALRAACRPQGQPLGMYIITHRDPWEVTAKAYLSIGHGASSIHFFNYGPYYAIAPDAQSHRPEIYDAIKAAGMPTGQVEGYLVQARSARGDAAQLLSVTSDIWNLTGDNVFGRERAFLNLLLRHCNFRLDVLSEDDLSTELKHYRCLFVTDSHIRRAQMEPLKAWLNNGGTLYLGAGALEFDEYNRPLEWGIKRSPLKMVHDPGRAQLEMPKLEKLGEYASMDIVSGSQEPLAQEIKYGKGKIILCGFFPAISYIGRARKVENATYSILDYPEAHRKYFSGFLRPRLQTDHYLVESNLLEGPAADLLVFSNWTGKEQTVTVVLQASGRYSRVFAAGGKLIGYEQKNNTLTATVQTGAGGYLVCVK